VRFDDRLKVDEEWGLLGEESKLREMNLGVTASKCCKKHGFFLAT